MFLRRPRDDDDDKQHRPAEATARRLDALFRSLLVAAALADVAAPIAQVVVPDHPITGASCRHLPCGARPAP